MRAVWVDAGNDPDPVKLAANGITVPYLDARWVAAKPNPLGYLQWVRELAGMTGAGLFVCDPWQWRGTGPLEPEAWADWTYNLVQKQCAPGTSGAFPSVHLNYEQDDTAWLLAMLRRWRAHSPKRTTAFVVQAHKWPVYASLAGTIASLAVSVVPECFTGAMVRVESAAEVQGWQAVGGSTLNVYPMLDGAQLGAEWDGCAFTMGRLP